jgi:hypothetical protein
MPDHEPVPGRKRLAATVRPSPDDVQRAAAEAGPPLLNGHRLRCPGCENEADLLSYVPLQYSEKYADQIVVPLVCRRCRHTFALRPGLGDV